MLPPSSSSLCVFWPVQEPTLDYSHFIFCSTLKYVSPLIVCVHVSTVNYLLQFLWALTLAFLACSLRSIIMCFLPSLCVCLSVGNNFQNCWTDFREIWCCGIYKNLFTHFSLGWNVVLTDTVHSGLHIFLHTSQVICLASFRETCEWLKFPLNGLRAQSRVSPVVGLLPLPSGLACLGMAFPPFLMKQIYHWYFWMCETGTGQQVAQLHDRYMMMMMMMTISKSMVFIPVYDTWKK